MNWGQVWLQIFSAVFPVLIQKFEGQPHLAAAAARAHTDEAMLQLHPKVLDIETNKVIPVSIGEVLDPPNPIPPIEDDLEQARRQPHLTGTTGPIAIEDAVSQATR